MKWSVLNIGNQLKGRKVGFTGMYIFLWSRKTNSCWLDILRQEKPVSFFFLLSCHVWDYACDGLSDHLPPTDHTQLRLEPKSRVRVASRVAQPKASRPSAPCAARRAAAACGTDRVRNGIGCVWRHVAGQHVCPGLLGQRDPEAHHQPAGRGRGVFRDKDRVVR